MALIDHIRRCNSYRPEDFVSWSIEDKIAGYVRRELRGTLAGYRGLFTDGGDLRLDPRHADAAARSEALREASERLHRAGIVHRLTEERYPVLAGGEEVATLPRGAAAVLGIVASGCHVNGFVRRRDGIHLWIGRRAASRPYPGKLDNFVAGGQPAGLSVVDNLIKECAEEAGVPEALARGAVPVGIVSYVMATEPGMGGDGLNRHALHCFDLELPDGFQPVSADGEVAEFRLLPAAEVQAIVESGHSFKFNCALVIIDFLIRHGILSPNRADYVDLCTGLRSPLERIR
ncbi:MAG: DUF4743 domain-containing protein [Alphaproteobacteria bacterium]|nr:DUF4743 domain-containing protein [Alphaproteobacteria bacterium]